MSKGLVLGCCSTGAKFTPMNHRPTGDAVLDRICAGADIPVTLDAIGAEVSALRSLGVGYYHYHARSPATSEQTTDDAVYADVGRMLAAEAPGMLVSFGASRNGPEVIRRIEAHGEWERVSHAAIPLADGGAHFVTMQAAIELQVVCEIERTFGRLLPEAVDGDVFRTLALSYMPSRRAEDMRMETHSTANGSNYGRSSPAIQVEAYGRAVAARRALGLWDEVEWVQLERSYAMTRFALMRDDIALGGAGQLNVTLLFGFSPKLPFPGSYAEFRRAVDLARSLERDTPDGPRVRNVTVSVGAAVLPHHAAGLVRALDVGRDRGTLADAHRILAAYACQEDSGVDVLRFGMEDTPFRLDVSGRPAPTGNVALCTLAAAHVEREGGFLIPPDRLTDRVPALALAA